MQTDRTAAGRDLLRIEGLEVTFPLLRGSFTAVRGVSLRVLPGRITALVGESGSGKSVTGQCILGLQSPTAKVSGRILFDGGEGPVDILPLPRDGRQIRAIRTARIGMIFQEPMTSFSPLHTIGNQVSEALRLHRIVTQAQARDETEAVLARVGFADPRRAFGMYPFELSGGMRQRAMIAMAVICRPALLIADEPTTALDVTIQAQILGLIRDLQQEMGLGVLLITHDLGVVANIADEVVVMHRGQVMEAGPTATIFSAPRHPYLKGLMQAIPAFGPRGKERLRPLREIPAEGITALARLCGAPGLGKGTGGIGTGATGARLPAHAPSRAPESPALPMPSPASPPPAAATPEPPPAPPAPRGGEAPEWARTLVGRPRPAEAPRPVTAPPLTAPPVSAPVEGPGKAPDAPSPRRLTPVALPAAPVATPPRPLIRLRHVGKSFATRSQSWSLFSKTETAVRAVDDVSFDILRGECLGLVGESGSGKTTLGKMLVRAIRPDTGEIVMEDAGGPIDVAAAEGEALDRLRTRTQMIFQDPVSSLSPRMTVGRILAEPLEIHRRGTPDERRAMVAALLNAVGLGADAAERFPHSFSGGQRQRIGIARALALAPEFIVCDEPVSALDVSVQAQILNLLKDLQAELGLTYLFVSHNLAVVNYMADRVAVMWRGRLVEIGPCDAIMAAPMHPYTQALLRAVPVPDPDHPLDLHAARRPAAEAEADWPAEFREDAGTRLMDLGGGHFVRMRPDSAIRERAS